MATIDNSKINIKDRLRAGLQVQRSNYLKERSPEVKKKIKLLINEYKRLLKVWGT